MNKEISVDLAKRESLLQLPEVALCAVTSVNVPATLRAISLASSKIDFGSIMLFTDATSNLEDKNVEIVRIKKINSSSAYSSFILKDLPAYINTEYCMIVQWDGYPLNTSKWRDEYLAYDYIGARWPQFQDGHDVGNGGFSLRSARLMKLCSHADFLAQHPEDVSIGRLNRQWLEDRGMRFAPGALADTFAAERAGDPRQSFGYHGFFHMPNVLGPRDFWKLYQNLDNRRTVLRDFWPMLRSLMRGRGGLRRAISFTKDQLSAR